MASYTITTSNGLDDLIDQFTQAIISGKRFKTVNYFENEKDSILRLIDYNFYTNHKDLNSLTSGNNWKITFEDDNYVLPPNVVLPNFETEDGVFGVDSKGRKNGASLGTVLMAIQHIAGSFDFDTQYPNKSSITEFMTTVKILITSIINFNESLNQYIEIPAQTAVGDFKISFESAGVDSSIANRPIVGSSVDVTEIRLDFLNNRVRLVSQGIFVSFVDSLLGVDPAKDNVFTLERIGSQVSLTVNGFLEPAITSSATYIFDRLASRGNTYFTGVVRNVDFLSGFTNNPLYPLDDTLLASDGVTPSTVIRNSRAVLGPELYDQTKVSNIGTNITVDPVSGVITKTGNLSTGVDFGVDHGLVNGQVAIVAFDYSNAGGNDSAGLSNGSLFGGEPASERLQSGNGHFERVLTVTDQSNPIRIAFSSSSGIISNLTVRRADGYGTAVNLTAANTELMTQEPTGNLRGNNVWEQGDYVYTGIGGGFDVKLTQSGFVSGFNYEYSAATSGIIAGDAVLRLGSTNLVETSQDGSFSGSNVANGSSAFVRSGAIEPNAGAVMSGIDIHRLIEKAIQFKEYLTSIMNFDDSLQQYISIPEQTASGDFEFEVEGVFPSSGFYLIATKDTSTTRLLVTSGGVVYCTSTVGTLADTSWMGDEKLHKLNFKRQGSVLDVSVDGVIHLTNSNSDVLSIDSLFAQWGGGTSIPYLTGVGRNVNFISGFTSNPLYPLDDSLVAIDGITPSKVVKNSRAVLGPNVINPVDLGSGWTDNGNGVWEITTGFNSFLDLGGDTANDFLFTYENNTNPTLQITNGVTPQSIPSGSGELVVRSGTLTPRLSGPLGATITLVSLEQAEGYGTAENLLPEHTEKMTVQNDGSLLGRNLWTNGDYTYTGAEVGNSNMFPTLTVLTTGEIYQWSWTHTIVGSATTNLRLGTTVSNESTSGTFSGVSVATGTSLRMLVGGSPSLSTGTTVTNVNTRRLIQKAT